MTTIDVLAAGEPSPYLPHLGEIIVGLVAFSILVYIGARVGWPMFVKSHENDTGHIRSGIERADADQEDARAELERNREKLAGVDNEAARIRDDARADAEHIKEDMARRANEEAERIRAQGRQSLDASRSRTVSELRADVGTRSVELARRIVAADLADENSRGRSVDRFLAELEGMGGGSANGSDAPAREPAPSGAGATGAASESSGKSLPGFPPLKSNGESR